MQIQPRQLVEFGLIGFLGQCLALLNRPRDHDVLEVFVDFRELGIGQFQVHADHKQVVDISHAMVNAIEG